MVQHSTSIRINEITPKKVNEEQMIHQTRCAFLVFTYTATRSLSFEDYEQLYIEHTCLPDESSQVNDCSVLNLHREVPFVHRRPPVNVPIRRMAHCF